MHYECKMRTTWNLTPHGDCEPILWREQVAEYWAYDKQPRSLGTEKSLWLQEGLRSKAALGIGLGKRTRVLDSRSSWIVASRKFPSPRRPGQSLDKIVHFVDSGNGHFPVYAGSRGIV